VTSAGLFKKTPTSPEERDHCWTVQKTPTNLGERDPYWT
jgi:hypothetical protein